MLVNIHGEKSHDIIESALKVLENMRHRGAEGADNKTGDGAGILLQIPHEFILLQGIPVPEKGKYGTGLIFLPKDEEQQASILSILIEEIEKEGLTLMHLRKVPVHTEILGKDAQATEPDIKQIFIIGCNDQQELELKLYLIRKRVEKRVSATDLPAKDDFYIASLSTKNIVYKGMLESMQLRHYFPDLTQPYFTSGLALVHSRFSTNTFPTWSLAQPFRLLAHNGEINTIRGNRGWMEARESVLSSPRIPDINDIRPIIQPGMSDSASLDNCRYGDEEIPLTGTEFSIMLQLVQAKGAPVSKETLYIKALGRVRQSKDRTIDVHMSSIRRKLTAGTKGRLEVANRRNVGYQLVDSMDEGD